MEKKKIIPIWLSIVLVILILASIVFSVFNLFTSDAGYDKPFLYLTIIIDLCALYYCFMGYSKSGAVYFKLYCYLNILLIAITLFFDSMTFSVNVLSAILFALPLLELMIYFVFSTVPNLGKKKSLTLVSILSALIIIEDIILSVTNPSILPFCAESIVITGVFFVMVIAKYKDKAERGSN